MEPERARDRDGATREALDAFRAAIGAGATVAGRERLRAALASERRVARGRGLGLKLVQAAAVLALALGGFLFWRHSTSARDAVACPHGTPAAENGAALPETLRAFLENPDNFQRVCHCQPRFSGNLRRGLASPHAP
ncbi:MAG: hypothetical protein IT577_18805 [Verrucomicrobiae bacterium]|nr:hypothetical protein [Verrucomicrobiae bacterium]